MEDNELIDDQIRAVENNLAASEELVNGLARDIDLRYTAVRLVDLHRIAPVVLDRDAELGPLDAQRSILRDQHRRHTFVNKIEAGCEDAVVDGRRIEDLRETVRSDSVQFDPERAPTGKICRRRQPAGLGCPETLQQSNHRPCVRTDLIHPRLLPIEFLYDDEWKHHIVFIESEQGTGVSKENACIDHVVRRRQGASLSRHMCVKKGCRVAR